MDGITGASFFLNALVIGVALVLLSSSFHKRRLAAWLWSSAKAQDEKRAAIAGINSEALRYEAHLIKRGDPVPDGRLIEIPGESRERLG